ncbi:MAG: OmpA family protein [bacterium]
MAKPYGWTLAVRAAALAALIAGTIPSSASAQPGHPTGLRGGLLVPSALTLNGGSAVLGSYGSFTREGNLNSVTGNGYGAWGVSDVLQVYGSRATFFSGTGPGYFDYSGFTQGDAVGPLGLVLRLPGERSRPFQFAFQGAMTPAINSRWVIGHDYPYGRDSFDIHLSLLQGVSAGQVDLRFIEGLVVSDDSPGSVGTHAVLGGGMTWWAARWLGLEAELLSRLETEAPVGIMDDYLGASGGITLQLTDWLAARGGYLLGLSSERTDGVGTRAESWMAYGQMELQLGRTSHREPVRRRAARAREPGEPTEVIPEDSDADGVPDSIDLEPDTPLGAEVDARGRAVDSDGDGVPDGIDQEPQTLPGAVVDEFGRALDTDGDGIPDGIDVEPDTPEGAAVDAEGRAIDSDGDGVPDGIDVEPDTPRGMPVDARGRALTGMEAELITRGLLTLNTVYFDYNSTRIKPESYATLREVGLILAKYDDLKVEVGGHTDSIGGETYNQALSLARAQAVLNWLLDNIPELSLSQFTLYGYGESQPVATNDTEEGRLLNRRVEFKVLNTSELEKYRPPNGG